MAFKVRQAFAAVLLAVPLLISGCAEIVERKPVLDDGLFRKLIPAVIVGAPDERISDGERQVQEGAAYVFGRPVIQRLLIAGEQPKWLFPMQQLRGAGAGANGSGDRFGSASLLADFDSDGVVEIVVGNPGGSRPGGERGGLLHLFRQADGVYVHRQQLAKGLDPASDLGLPGLLGDAVGVADINGDGAPDLVAASPGHPIGDVRAKGAVFLYRRVPLLPQNDNQSLLGPIPGMLAAGDLDTSQIESALGADIIIGDFNGDQLPDIVAVAPRFVLSQPDISGALFEFPGDADASSGFGAPILHTGIDYARIQDDRQSHDLAADGFDADAFDDLAVGIPAFGPRAADGSDPAGAVVIFSGGPGGLSFSQRLRTDGFQGLGAGDNFGESVAVGDFDGDGRTDLAVGASNATSSLFAGVEVPPDRDVTGRPVGELPPSPRLTTGRVYIYRGTPEGFAPWRAIGHGDERQFGQQFGRSLHASDLNGDGKTDLVVGAPERMVSPGSPERSGAAFVYSGGTGGMILVQTLTQAGLDPDEEGDGFGMFLNN